MKNIEDIANKIQANLEESGDSYRLKTDSQIIDMIIDFGCGETEFHTADIERILRQKRLLQEKVDVLLEIINKA